MLFGNGDASTKGGDRMKEKAKSQLIKWLALALLLGAAARLLEALADNIRLLLQIILG